MQEMPKLFERTRRAADNGFSLVHHLSHGLQFMLALRRGFDLLLGNFRCGPGESGEEQRAEIVGFG